MLLKIILFKHFFGKKIFINVQMEVKKAGFYAENAPTKSRDKKYLI